MKKSIDCHYCLPPRGITAARPPFLPLRLDAWARLRGILGRLRGILGRLGTSKNAIESKTDFNIENEAKMKRPESPPESPGNYFWVPKCNQNRSKTRLKRLLFCIIFSMHFFFDLNSIFPPNLAPKTHQNRRKIGAKMPSQVDLVLGLIFYRF